MDKNNKTETNSQIQRTDWWLPQGREVGEGAKWVRGIKRYKLLDIKQIYYKDVMYSTGNVANIL